MHARLYHIAFVQGDAAAMKEQIDWAAGRPEESQARNWQAQAAEFSGKLAQANQFNEQEIELAQRRTDLKEAAAHTLLQEAGRNATFGNCKTVSELTGKALTLSREQASLVAAAVALAACNQNSQAQSLTAELSKSFPQDTLLNMVSIPLINSQLELSKGNAAQVIQLLEPARRFEVYGDYWQQYLRGQAYLKQRNASQASTEFQTIIDHRGWYPLSPLYPLPHLGLPPPPPPNAHAPNPRQPYPTL